MGTGYFSFRKVACPHFYPPFLSDMTDICPHFNDCGGCDLQDRPYNEQLRIKLAAVKDLLSGLEAESFLDIAPSPEIWHYRNKMDFIIGGPFNTPQIGLRKKKKFDYLVNLDECRIFNELFGRISDIVKTRKAKRGITPYSFQTRSGFGRYLGFRHSKRYGDLMMVFVASSQVISKKEKNFLSELIKDLKDIVNIRSVYLAVNNGVADVAQGDRYVLLYGSPTIKENINGIDYILDPSIFFQTNSYCCQELYKIAKGFTAVDNALKAIDLYCGSGGITLALADRFLHVIGVDNQPKNIEMARLNAALNSIKNVEFVESDAASYLLRQKDEGNLESISTLIVDPPRSGLSKNIKNIILECNFKKIIYVSCNPSSLKSDLEILKTGYHIETIIPIDMFPHTRHIEVICALSRDRH